MPKQLIKPFYLTFSTLTLIYSFVISLGMNLRATENLLPFNVPSANGLKTRSKLPHLILGSQSLQRYYRISYSAFARWIVTHCVVVPRLSLLPAIQNCLGIFLILLAIQCTACIVSMLVLNTATLRYCGYERSVFFLSFIFMRLRAVFDREDFRNS